MYSLYHILLYFPLAAMVAISIVILDVVILFDSSDQNTYIENLNRLVVEDLFNIFGHEHNKAMYRVTLRSTMYHSSDQCTPFFTAML